MANTEKTYAEMRDLLLGKAAQDADFRGRLLSDPKAAVAEALSVTLPESLTIAVHEESATSAHLVLPPRAALSDEDLQAIAAGDPAEYGEIHWHAGVY